MIIAMRLPVTSSRRCEQITAFGASDVPDVKINAQIASTSGSSPGSAASRAARARRRGTRPASTADRRRRRTGSTTGSAEVGRRSAPAGASWRGSVITSPQCVCCASRRRCSSRRVWLSPTIARADQRRAAEREQVVGRVVEQHRDVARARRPGSRSRNSAANRHDSSKYSACVQARSPNLIATRSPNSSRVAPQQRGRVRRDERRLAGRGHRPRGRDLTWVSDPSESDGLRSPRVSVDLAGARRPALSLRARPAPGAVGRRVRGRTRGRGRRAPGDRAEVARLPHRVAGVGGAARRRRRDLRVRRHLLRPRGRRR